MTALSDRINRANRHDWTSRKIESLAKDAGHTLSNGTAHKILAGTHGTPSDSTLAALADVFNLDENELRELSGLPAVGEPYRPPEAANRLTPQQRDLLNALIHQLVRPHEGGTAATVTRLPTRPSQPAKKAARKTTRPKNT